MQILGRKKKIIATSVGIEELVTKNSYDITSADIDLGSDYALLKVWSTASGNIKVDLAGSGTTITMDADNVNEANVHVSKIYQTGTTIGNTFYLWQ